MASTTDNNMMAPGDEIRFEAIKNQILSNLRILNPSIADPTITTALSRDKETWRATVWDDKNNVVFCTTGVTSKTMSAAMHNLLLLTSTIVDKQLDRWEARSKSGRFQLAHGVMYT